MNKKAPHLKEELRLKVDLNSVCSIVTKLTEYPCIWYFSQPYEIKFIFGARSTLVHVKDLITKSDASNIALMVINYSR